MRFTNVLSLFALASAAAAAAVQANVTQYISVLPKCGLDCIFEYLPSSPCGFNQTCICEDKVLAAKTHACLSRSCTVVETLQVANLSTITCGRNHPDKSSQINYTCISGAIAFLFVMVRLISRWEEGGFNVEDYIMASVGLCMIPILCLGVLAAKYAFGRNIWDIPTDSIIKGLKFLYWSELCYITVLGLCKISILMFYLRIFPTRIFRFWCLATLSVVTLSMVTFQFMILFQCWPISYNWTGWKGDIEGKCLDIQAFNYVSSSFNIVLDAAILVLPLPSLLKLNIGPRKKISVICMFSLGIFIFIVSVLRINFVQKFKSSFNPTWDYTDAIIWSGIETHVSVMVPCLPAIRTFLSRRCPRVFGIETRKGTNASYGNSQGANNISSKSFRMVSITTSSGLAGKNTEGDTEKANQPSNVTLGYQMKGTVHTGITGGKRSNSGSQEYLVIEKP